MSYSGIAKDGPAEGRTLHSDANPLRVPIQRRHRLPPSADMLPPGSNPVEVAYYVHITDHNGTDWWLWEQGWLINLIRHADRERYTAISYLLG